MKFLNSIHSQLSWASLSDVQVSCSYFTEEYGNVYTKNYKKMYCCILNICPASEWKPDRQPELDPVFLSVYRFYGNTTFYCIPGWIYVLIFCDKKKNCRFGSSFSFQVILFLQNPNPFHLLHLRIRSLPFQQNRFLECLLLFYQLFFPDGNISNHPIQESSRKWYSEITIQL